MTDERRLFFLKIGVAAVVSLYLLDNFVIEPAIGNWKEQSARITALKQKVTQGRQLKAREASLRERWAGMLRGNLPAEDSAADSAAFQALERCKMHSQIMLNTVTPAWQLRPGEIYDTLEYRLSATGNQATLGQFLYALETDVTVPLNVEECELATHDARGAQLTLTARITFLRLKENSVSKIP
jgi:hypothetical protein